MAKSISADGICACGADLMSGDEECTCPDVTLEELKERHARFAANVELR